MKNKKRNRKYIKKYADILKNIMNENLGEKSILYIVNGILGSDKPMEECYGFDLLDEYINYLVNQGKIDYFMQHTESLQRGMMNKVDNEKTLLFAMKEALISNKPLENCSDYSSLQQYFEQDDVPQTLDDQQTSLIFLNLLSNMTNVMRRVQETDQIDKIISYYSYINIDQPEPYQKTYSA